MTSSQYTPMIQQYLQIKANYKDSLLFFRLGDFYEMFFEDAEKAARELEITLTGRDGGTDEKIPMCGVPYHAAEHYISQLIEKGYKVAICEQVEDPKEAKGVVRREVVRVITPGTTMEGKKLLEKENNYLVSLFSVPSGWSIAACDVTTGDFLATELSENFQQALDEAAQFQPAELLIPEQELNQERIQLIRQLTNATISTIAINHGKDEDQDINFIGENASPGIHAAVRGLLQYIKENQKASLRHLNSVKIYAKEEFLMIDPVSKRNLELIETIRQKKREGSLLWFLDKTMTAMGGRLLKHWLDKPLINIDQIEERHQAITYFINHVIPRNEIRTILKRVYDIERLISRISFGNANGRDLAHLSISLSLLPKLANLFYSEGNKFEYPYLFRIIDQMDLAEDIVQLLQSAIVDNPPLSVKEGGIIRDGYSSYLDQLRSARKEGKHWIAQLEQRERQETGIRSLKVGFNKVFGYFIEVTKPNLHLLPKDRYERKQTLANSERFITPELKEKEALILEAEEKIQTLEYDLFCEVRDKVAQQIHRLKKIAKDLAQIDVLQSLATVSDDHGFVKPVLTEKGVLHLTDNRHPVVESVLQDGPFVSNDVFIGDDQQILLITGPNMAGKSTYMRQIAISVILAQMGCFVPAKKAKMPIFDRIFTRIGAADDLVGGQSTFMVEMHDICVTTTQATDRSLVLIDEIGRGTSTQDGMAIAQSVIEYLHDRIHCKALVSTHYHELSALENQLPKLKNFCMAVKEEGDQVHFLRKIKRGAADKSYGIYCAKIAGVPNDIINRAIELISVHEEMKHQVQETATSNETNIVTIEEPIQLELFSSRELEKEKKRNDKHEEVIKKLKEVDLINMTPLEAINFLYEIKKKI
ncbi:DNA mismatch repair protein MutS [Microaerobacter geothermalis]|uniref:DNA mismatch repair protein MutS n=1 Tax=Microaerobacter geothermalis TaxID=674972 RepID=UPI001F21D017|nr:DNA mismatch repair protein MutS [Microaerobacter geothermalis]MCF6093132.1 DNA mismatch repair protein MutS [Microaerobacter geothermalis]